MNENGATNLVGTTLNINFTRPATFGIRHHSPPNNILCASPWKLHPNVTFPQDSQGLQSGSLKTRTIVVPKLWRFISFSNPICFENARVIYYSAQKNLFNGAWKSLIESHLTPPFKGLVVGSQIHNLTPTPSFDHNLCKSSLNEQCEGTLSIYISINFQWCLGGPI